MAVLDKNPPVGSDNEKNRSGVMRAFSQSIEAKKSVMGGRGGTLGWRKV